LTELEDHPSEDNKEELLEEETQEEETQEEFVVPKKKDSRKTDTFLESLIFLSKYHQKTISVDSMISGVLSSNKSMDIETFITASKKAGLITKVAHRKLENISALALPALLLLKGNRACVLLDINLEEDKVRLLIPGLPGETIMTQERINLEYSDTVIIVRNDFQFKNRVHKEVKIEKPKEWFWGTMKKNKAIFKKVAIAAVVINLFVVVTPLFTMNVYDRVLPNNALDTLWVLAIGVFIVMIFDFVLKLTRSHYLGLANKRADIIMSNKIFDKLLNIRLDEKPSSTGMFLSRIQSFESVREFFSTATIALIVDLPFVLVFVGIIFFIGGAMAYISIATIIIVFLFSYYMQKPIKNIIEKSAKEDQIKMTVLNETITGLEIIKMVRGQNRMKVQFENSLKNTAYYGEKSQHLSQTVTYFTAFISQFSNIAIVITGVYLASEGEITMGVIIAAMMLNGRVVGPISQVVSMIIRYDRTMLSLNNIDELMKMEVEREDKAYLARPNLQGNIVFKDVDFSYKDQNLKALKNINLNIKEGEKIAILGKIGSGKSTLGKLIMNLYSPTSGSVIFDGTDVRQIDPVDLRRSIGYVPQEPFLFLGTLKDNITIGENFATDEDLIYASKIAGLHDFLGKHEAGFDLIVGERGDGISGGERQAITLARALISKPNLLIMDEPTNSMDIQTENAFIHNIGNNIKNKTMIIITHKMSILKLVDRVIVLHDGKIVADGKKEDVIKSLKTEK
jgi:ATP-binding cassette subfamily C protein LapB